MPGGKAAEDARFERFARAKAQAGFQSGEGIGRESHAGLDGEAEFVLPTAVADYYLAFTTGYRQRRPELRPTAAAPDLDEDTAIEYLMGLAHYFGIETAFDQAPGDARALVEAIGGYLAKGLSDHL